MSNTYRRWLDEQIRIDTFALLDENISRKKEHITKLESTLKSIQTLSGDDWYQGASSDGPSFVMKTILEKCDEALGADEKGQG